MIGLLSIILALKEFTFPPSNHSHPEQHQKKPSKKCSFHTPSDAQIPDIAPHHSLVVFISFSAPLETWKEHSYYLEQIKGAFVLRGLPQNSFEQLKSKILELRKAGVQAEIVVDPEAFDRYEIQHVPSILLHHERKYDKVSGNIPVLSALTLFSEKGETQAAARELLKKVKSSL